MLYPERVQRKRIRGWKMPEETVYVGRPSKWGNPYNWKDYLMPGVPESNAKKIAKEQFEKYIAGFDIAFIKNELKGKNIACWCKVGDHCHGDVLLRIANDLPF